MGNQIGKGANRMAIAAMSNVTHVEKRELASLQSKFREIASREGNASVLSRVEFTEALSIVGINQNAISTRQKRAHLNEIMELDLMYRQKIAALS